MSGPQEENMKPFAGYEDMQECISDNQDKDDPAAYCAYLHHQDTGEWPAGDKSRPVERKLITPNALSSKGVEIGTEEMDGKEFTTLTIPISSTNVDRDFDNFTESAINSMKEQLKSGKVGMFLDHGGENNQYPVLDMIGGFYDGVIDGDILLGKAFVDPDDEKASTLVKKIKNNLPVGWSVGFADAAKKENDHGGYLIEDLDLAEVSAVGIPSNPDAIVSFADTVAKRAAIQVKNLMQKEDDKMSEQEEEPVVEDGTKDDEKDPIHMLADELDTNPNAIRDALQDAGILPKEDDDEEREDDDDDDEEDKGFTLEDIRQVVRDEVAKSMKDVNEPAEEPEDGPEDDEVKEDPKVQEPKGKIVTPKEPKDEKSTGPEEGENDGLKFHPNI